MKYLALLLATQVAAVAAAPNYKVVDQIAIGGEARWDYVYLDQVAHRLYVAHGKQTDVIDTTSNKVVGAVTGGKGVHGIAVAQELGLGYATSGEDSSVTVFDLKTLKVTASIPVGKKPDAIVYDALDQRVVALNGHGDSASIIDAKKGEVVATVALGGNPEFAVVDAKGTVYVNIESTAELVALDTVAAKVTKRIALKPCEEPTGLAFDGERHLFSVCKNHLMMITDLANDQVSQAPIGASPDGVAWLDGYAFSANGGDGNLSVVGQSDKGTFSTVATINTAYGARTIAADSQTHKLYLPTADFKLADGKAKRQGIDDTFRVLVLEKQ
ncbi:MAG: YncE family protein [Burkholderiales bacterium]|nr:YncE family protein [Burkholderiales bacterium]